MPLSGVPPLFPRAGRELAPCLVIGGGAFGDELKKLMETSSVAAKADELEAKIQGNTWKTVVFAETLVAEDPTAEGPAMAALLSAAQAAAMSPSMRFVVLTAGAQEAEASGDFMGRGLLGAAALGFMRSMPLEAPKLQAQVIDLTGPQLPPFFFPRFFFKFSGHPIIVLQLFAASSFRGRVLTAAP